MEGSGPGENTEFQLRDQYSTKTNKGLRRVIRNPLFLLEGDARIDRPPHLMSITKDWRICVWNILRYATRLWNGHAKDHDLEKIAHYAELAWTLSEGKVVESEESDV